MPRALPLLLSALPLSAALLLAVPAAATDLCAKHLKTTCTTCHSIDEPRKQLGKPLDEWKDLLGRMRVNGAEIGKAAAEQMAVCLSQPSDAAKKACGK